MKTVFFIILYSLFFIPAFTHAQFNLSGMVGSLPDELNVAVSPAYPEAGEQVFLNLEMYTENLDTADISYYVGGTRIASGKGLKTFSFAAPAAGSTRTVRIVVTLARGTTFEKTITVAPISLELLWEGNSYTPPFYLGRNLFPPQGSIRVFALASSQNMVFTWMVNGSVRQDLSGYGKNSALISGPILGGPLEVEIVATDTTSNKSARKRIVITPQNPEVVFYEDNPLYGIIFERALTNIALETEEVGIVAAPFFMSREQVNNANYAWRVNGIQAEGLLSRSAIFRKPEGGAGRSAVSLDLLNTQRPLQSAKASFIINFEDQ